MFIKFLESLGDKTINLFSSFFNGLIFSLTCILHMINPKSYNPAMKMVIVRQIYFTAVTILPLFIVMALFFGSIIIGIVILVASEYSLQEKIGSIIINFVLNEFAPFFTTLLIALRSSTAVNTEIAVMKVNKELNVLKEYKIDLIDYLFIPRIISGIISMVSLSILFALIMLGSGYIFTLFYLNMDFYTYYFYLLDAIEISDIIILFTKSIIFGFLTMVIPIHSGINAFDSYTAIPISVLNGMVRLFIALFLVEVLSLLIILFV